MDSIKTGQFLSLTGTLRTVLRRAVTSSASPFLLAVLAAAFACSTSSDAAENPVTLTGSFTNQGKTYPLKGTLTSTDTDKWQVTWNFTFGRRGAQVFKGTVEGKPGKGEMKGKVVERRIFVFEGTWKDGRFEGKTAEYFKPGGKASPTGTLELSVAK